MRQRGPQPGAPGIQRRRPRAPDHLTAAEKEVWTQTAQGLSADHLTPESLPIFEAFVCCVVAYRYAQEQSREVIKQAQDGQGVATDLYKFWRDSAAKEASTLANLATKLRLTQQSTQDPKKGKHAPGGGAAPPWAGGKQGEDEQE